ncbi:MAG: membrane protein insertion efficiency factor YidD [Planctomycetota bacterium]
MLRLLNRTLATLLAVPVMLYQRVISPFKPKTCRFVPTCSEYARVALLRHGPLRGSYLAARRILRCHPFTEPGEDPVPERRHPKDTCCS